jgi:hypothetical protein
MKSTCFAAGIPLILVIVLTAGYAAADSVPYQELGVVDWLRDFERATELSEKTGKPLFMLFQEVPGCATCVNYGKQVLSHPLVAEAIETHFVPLAIFNNRGGDDLAVLSKFKEPTWNNPVVRIVDKNEKPLAKRLAGDYSIAGTTGTMIHALEQSHIPVPEYLQLVHEENSPYLIPETAVFSTYCFWSGEIEFGKIEGVVATAAGFMHGREVVEVRFNRGTISYAELLRKGKRSGVVRNAYVASDAQEQSAVRLLGRDRVAWVTSFHEDTQIKYYLSQTPYRYLPLTSLQAIHVNLAVAERRDPVTYLSQRQQEMLSYIMSNPDMGWQRRIDDVDFTASWNKVARAIEAVE